jgi:hypothetical protein
MTGLRALALVLLVAASLPRIAGAQSLRERISELFIFGSGSEPLFLAGSGDPSNPASLQAHGEHFIPASSAENASLIALIGDALGSASATSRSAPRAGGEFGAQVQEFLTSQPSQFLYLLASDFARRDITRPSLA